MNLYLDSVQALSKHYDICKIDCIAKNNVLKADIEDLKRERNESHKTRYFDPHSSDKCLSQCRAQFYFVFKRVNKYYLEDFGLYVERT